MSELNERSKQLRKDAYLLSKACGGYHYGGSFSCAEILIALYDTIILSDCDKFILSKGHGCWCYYALLMESGLSPKLDGHPHRDPSEGVEWTTGSEGQRLPVAMTLT